MTTITKRTNRILFEDVTYWAVTWGPGITQTIICGTEAEAVEVARTHRPAVKTVVPLVSMRDY
jgi:hypothetical protein